MGTGVVFFALIVGAIAIGVAVIWLQYYLEQQHVAAYQAFCASTGYQFVADRPGAQSDFTRIVPFFDRGYARRWRHQISGQYNGVAFSAFQYDYTISTGKSSSTYRHAMIKWTSARPLPQFTLAPETFFTRFGEMLGWHDIAFADDPAFNSAYVLKGEHEMDVATFFNLQKRQQLCSIPGQHAAGAGTVLFWWRDGGLPDPDAFVPFLAVGDQVRAILLQ